MCTTQVLAMEVEASLRYCGGVDVQGVDGGVKAEKVREVMEVGWAEGRKV